MVRGILLYVLSAMLIFGVGWFMWTRAVPAVRKRIP